jgi:hypothetical protein
MHVMCHMRRRIRARVYRNSKLTQVCMCQKRPSTEAKNDMTNTDIPGTRANWRRCSKTACILLLI